MIQYLIKQIIKGLNLIHQQNIVHGNISFNNIAINHKMNKNVQIKFINFSTDPKIIQNLKKNIIKKSKSKSKSKTKPNKYFDNLKKKYIIKFENLIKKLIILKYETRILKIQQEQNSQVNSSNFNIGKVFKSIFDKPETLEDILPRRLLNYIKIINMHMIEKQSNLEIVLDEILFNDKYKN